jgi:hypothetical protein
MKHEECSQGNFSKYHENLKKQSDRARGKHFFAPATWADYLSNLFVFNLFCNNVTVNIQNKNILC